MAETWRSAAGRRGASRRPGGCHSSLPNDDEGGFGGGERFGGRACDDSGSVAINFQRGVVQGTGGQAEVSSARRVVRAASEKGAPSGSSNQRFNAPRTWTRLKQIMGIHYVSIHNVD
jgi:hypothetical protein